MTYAARVTVTRAVPDVRTYRDSAGRPFRYILIDNPGAQTLVVHFSAFFGEWANARSYRFAYKGYFHRLRLFGGATQHHWLFLCDEYGAEFNGTYYTGVNGDLFVERAMQELIAGAMTELGVRAEETVTMGSSMGATAALKFGLLLRVRGIVAISPHIDLDVAAARCGRERHVAFICPDGEATSEQNHRYTRQVRSLIEGWRAEEERPPRLFVQVCQDDRGVYHEQVLPLAVAWKRAGGRVDLDERASGGHTSDWATRELLLDATARILSGEPLDITMYQTRQPYLGRLIRPPLSHRLRRSLSMTRKWILSRYRYWDEQMKNRLEQRIERMTDAATWLVFAKTAGDEQRRAYWRLLAFLRRRDIRRRTAAVKLLPCSELSIPREIGFARCTLSDLGAANSVVAEVVRIVSQQGDAPVGSKPYLVDRPVRGLPSSSELLRFAVNPRVVAPVASYLGMAPLLVSVTILESRAVVGAPAGSQLFHCDYEDVRQVKVFVACSDTRSENGPLRAISARQSQRIKDALGYRYGDRRFRVPDSIIADLVPSDEVAEFMGPPGSVTFIDTSSCFHCGSRIQPGSDGRLVLQFQYLTPAAFELAIAPRLRHPPISQSGDLQPLERLVLGRR